jgi:hypothetical protein
MSASRWPDARRKIGGLSKAEQQALLDRLGGAR